MYHVLYVDDEPDLLEVAKFFLEDTGEFTVTTGKSAREGLDLLRTCSFDAVISDYQMPGMDGILFLKEVRRQYGDLPFILFTGKGREEVVIEAINNGADSYLQKGGHPNPQFTELAHRLSAAIERRKSEDRILTLNRLYSVLSATNKAIVHIRNKPGLFAEICRILVEIGGFRMVWIGIAELRKKRIVPVASFGYTAGYLDTVDISTEDIPRGRGPTGTAYRERKCYFSNDITSDPRLEPWRDACLERGYRANAAVPFAAGTPNAGVISVYAPVSGFFTDDIFALLEEMARDISFALSTIDDEEQRKAAVDALRKSEVRFRSIIQRSDDYIVVVNRQGNVVYSSPAGKRILGYPDDFLIGKNPLDLIHPEDRERVEKSLKSIYKKDVIPHPVEYRARKADGSYVRLESHASHFFDVPEINGIVIASRDVTERRQAELELRAMYEQLAAAEEELKSQYNVIAENQKALCASEEKYRNILDNIQDVYYRTDVLGNTVMFSPSGARLLGYGSVDEILGKPAADYYVDPKQRQLFLASLDLDGAVSNMEITLKRKDGTPVIVSTSSHVYYDADGNCIGIEGIFRDITRSKEADENLRQSEEQYRILVEHSLDGTFLGQDGILKFCNEALAAMIGSTPTEIIGTPMRDLIAPEDRAMVMERQRNRLEGTSLAETYEFRLLHRDGVTRVPVIMSVGVAPYRNRLAVIGTMRDVTKDRERDRALRESEERFRNIADSTGEWIWETDPEGVFRYSSGAGEKILGYSPEELVGRMHFYDLFAPDVREEIKKLSLGAFERGVPVRNFVTPCLHKNGSRIILETSGVPIFDEQGQFTGYRGVEEDITRRVLAEQMLKENERQLQEAQEIAHMGSFTYDVRCDSWQASPEFYRIFGIDPSYPRTVDGWAAIVHPDDRTKATEKLRSAISRNELASMEYRIIRPASGETRWISALAKPECDSSGHVVRVTGTNLDITDRKRAEETLLESEERFTAFMANLPAAAFVKDPSGRTLFINPYLQELLGLGDYKGKTTPDLVPGEVANLMVEADRQALAKGPLKIQETMTDCHGAVRTFETIKFPIRVAGKPAVLGGISFDITDRKHTEDALRQANTQLNLLGRVSRHDILNKVTASLGYLGLIGIKSTDPALKEYTRRLEMTITSIRSEIEFTRAYQDLGTHEPRWQELDRIFPRLQVPDPITFTPDVAGVEIYSDPLIEKIFQNLLDNSVRHGQHVTEIRVSSCQSAEGLTVIWEDNGVGIPAEEKDRIFDRGFGKNTGLGLFLVREILALTRITIRETGIPGEGARFEILIPEGAYRVACCQK